MMSVWVKTIRKSIHETEICSNDIIKQECFASWRCMEKIEKQ